MKLIVGLGNPREKYKNNRHNVGFVVLDKLAQKLGFTNYDLRKDLKSLVIDHKSFVLAKPTTFMNNSGIAVKKLTAHYSLFTDHLYIVHDDLDLKLGDFKIQYAKGPKVHGGIADIEQKLSTKNFWRVRVGINSRKPESRTIGEKYVLQDFTKEEKKIVNAVIDKVINGLRDKIYDL